MTDVLLVRHTEVARAWRGRCYGISDMSLSRAGVQAARALVEAWATPVDAIVHSGLRRTAFLASLLGRRLGLVPTVDTDWRERDFGEWEGRSWYAIWHASGAAMDGMLSEPDSFRPGGGETTSAMTARAARGWARLPAGRVAVVAHAGTIAAIRSQRAGCPPSTIGDHIPALGSITCLPRQHGDLPW